MSFALTPLLPFVDGVTAITAAWLNHVRLALPDAVDGPGGGVYNLLPGHTLSFPAGGGDISFDAPFHFTDGDIPVGGHLDVLGIVTVRPGGSIYIDGSIGGGPGVLEIKQYGWLVAQSGSLSAWDVGSILSINGTATMAQGATLNVGHSSQGQGHIHILGAGSAAGSDLVMDAGSIAQLAGAVIITGATTLGGITQLTMSQPSATTDPGFANAFYAKTIAKAWASITFSGTPGVASIAEGYNISSATVGGAGSKVLTVNFIRAMANASYAVFVTPKITDGNLYFPQILSKSTTGFTLQMLKSIVGTPLPSSFGVVDTDDFSSFPELSFTVFAKQ
jgi:hypothetical protein